MQSSILQNTPKRLDSLEGGSSVIDLVNDKNLSAEETTVGEIRSELQSAHLIGLLVYSSCTKLEGQLTVEKSSHCVRFTSVPTVSAIWH